MRALLLGLVAAASINAMAQTAPAASAPAAAAAPPIPFKTVAEALAKLQAMDGNGVIVTHAEGWVTVNEPAAAAQWSFTPVGHYAHPAVVRRVVLRQAQGALSVDTQTVCEAPAAQCTKLVAEFESMNDRIVQSIRSRGRQGSPARQ